MRLLAVCQHYWPERFPITDVCEGLAARGHEVTVLTGQPNYPEGELFQGYERQDVREEEHNGVRVVRASLHPRKRGPVHRALNYHTFARSGARRAMDLPAGYDAVYVFQTSPVMMAEPAIAYCERHGAPLLLHVVDIWPECLTAGGIVRGSMVYEHYMRVSRRVYSAADRLAVSSRMFSNYLRDTVGVEGPEPAYLPQYVKDSPAVAPQGGPDPSLFPEGECHFMFAGNVGAAQSARTAVMAAAIAGPGVRVHIVGSGSELCDCKDFAASIGAGNVVFHGAHPAGEMPGYYAMADAMLATFADDPVLAYTLPRKVTSYLAAGKPVVGSVAGAAAQVIQEAGCGLVSAPEDAEALAASMLRFKSTGLAERRAMGERARACYDANFSEERFFGALEGELENLKGTRHGC